MSELVISQETSKKYIEQIDVLLAIEKEHLELYDECVELQKSFFELESSAVDIWLIESDQPNTPFMWSSERGFLFSHFIKQEFNFVLPKDTIFHNKHPKKRYQQLENLKDTLKLNKGEDQLILSESEIQEFVKGLSFGETDMDFLVKHKEELEKALEFLTEYVSGKENLVSDHVAKLEKEIKVRQAEQETRRV